MAWRAVLALLVALAVAWCEVGVLGARVTTQGEDAGSKPSSDDGWEVVSAADGAQSGSDASSPAEVDEAPQTNTTTTTTTTTEGPAQSAWELRKRIKRAKADANATDDEALEAAGGRVVELPEFQGAKCVRVNPHWREQHVRLAALQGGKVLVVPKAGLRGLSVLDPKKIAPELYEEAVTEAGIRKFGEPADFDTLKVDLFVVGTVAVNPATGSRLGGFGGLDELEYEVLRQLEVVKADTPVVTAVHELELRDDIPSDRIRCSELPVDIVCTPEDTIRVEAPAPKATGLNAAKIQKRQPRAVGFIGLLWDVRDRLEKSLGTQLALVEEELIKTAPEPKTTTLEPLIDGENWASSMWGIRNRLTSLVRETGINQKQVFKNSSFRVRDLPEFQSAKVIRVNPHWRDFHIRYAALKAGKTLVVPHPGLREISIVDPRGIKTEKDFVTASTETGLAKFGKPVNFRRDLKIDLFVVASMAASPSTGCRLGHFGGYEELEYQLLRQLKVIGEDTPVVTSVHDLEAIEDIPNANIKCELLSADIVCTPTRSIHLYSLPAKPAGLIVNKLIPRQLASSTVIKKLRATLEKELGVELPIPEVEQLLLGERERPVPSTRSGKGGRKAADLEREAEAVAAEIMAAAARSGKGGRRAAEEPAPEAPRTGKGGKQEEVVEEAPVARSGKGGRQEETTTTPAPRTGGGGKQEPVVEVPAAPAPAPATRKHRGGRQALAADVQEAEEPAPRTGKGGKMEEVVEEVAVEPVARSGKGGSKEEPAVAEVEQRSGKGGRQEATTTEAPAAPEPHKRRTRRPSTTAPPAVQEEG